jgi:uncharacterized membrane protein YqaE (UPF0057 family)
MSDTNEDKTTTSKNKLPKEYVRPKIDYSNTPAYRRKLKRENRKRAEKAGKLGGQGPITMFIIYLFDFIIKLVLRLGEVVLEFGSIGFGTVYDVFYGTFDGFIPNSEKFGSVIGIKYLRYTITLLIPPLGVFLSKGLYGWFNILICFLLTYIHIILGIIYAFVITYRNRYADRYEEMEYKRLMMIREYINSCTGKGDKITSLTDAGWMIGSIIVFIIALLVLLIYSFKYL